MNILFLTHHFYPEIGGVEKHVLEISKILKNQGFKITIISEESTRSFTNVQDDNLINDIKIYRIPSFPNDKLKKFKIWFWFFKNISLIKNADIIHAHDVFFWYLPFRFLFLNKKIFTTFHGYETIFPPKKSAIFIRRLSKFLSMGTINIGEYINKWYKTPANFTIYGGVEAVKNEELKVKINNNLNIVFIGRIEKDNGVEIYSGILKILKDKKTKFKFTAVGNGSFKNIFKEYGLVTGFIKNTDDYIKNADIIFASSYLSILEAFSFKKLVISVYTNELKKDYLEMTPFSEFLVKGNNPEKIIDQFLNLNNKEKNEMLEKEYNFVKENTWEDLAKIYKKLWKI